MAEHHVSVLKPFANGDVNEWFKRYKICCKANGWLSFAKVMVVGSGIIDGVPV